MRKEIIETEDGSRTIYLPELDETYHSIHGAINEALHVFINNGIALLGKKTISVFEVGFGTGLNAYLTAKYCQEHSKEVFYTSVEKYPLKQEIINQLNENKIFDSALFSKIHELEWERSKQITSYFSLLKMETDLIKSPLCLDEQFDIVFFDAFAPSKQPEIWTEEVFAKVYKILKTEGVLVTYSAAGVVKRALRSVGFEVKRKKGPAGKHHMLIAKKE